MKATRFPQKAAGVTKAADRYAVSTNGGLIRGFLLSRQVMECSDRTLGDYESRLGQFQKCLSDISLTAVTRQDIEGYLMWLKEHGRASWTLRTNYRVLKAFYNWLVEEEFIEVSPLLRIKPPRVPKLGKPFIGEQERDLLLDCCDVRSFYGARAAAMVWLLWGTGMRLSELAGLEIDDLDWDWGPKKCGRIRVFGKGRRERYTEFPKEAKHAVWRYLTHRTDGLAQLWVTPGGIPLEPDGVRHVVVRLYGKAGLQVKDVCHVFRRSWAMRNLKAGIPVKYVQLVGGWSNMSVLDSYVQAMTSEDALGQPWV